MWRVTYSSLVSDMQQARLGADWDGKRRRTSIVKGDETAVWALLSQLRQEYAPSFTPSSQASASPKKVPLPISVPVQRHGIVTPNVTYDFALQCTTGAYPSTPSSATHVVIRSPAAARIDPHIPDLCSIILQYFYIIAS